MEPGTAMVVMAGGAAHAGRMATEAAGASPVLQL